MRAVSVSQIKALLKKDVIVRWRQWWLSILQVVWPCCVFMLLFIIRLKFGSVEREDCQFPTRLLPTKNNVLNGFFTYVCSLENKCSSAEKYEEFASYEHSPMKPIIEIVQILINDEKLFNSIVQLPRMEEPSFIPIVTTLVTGGHLDEIRENIAKVIDLVPEVEKSLGGSFDVKRLFSDRSTFVRGGYLLCGHPFPNTDTIPIVNDILYSEDFSDANQDELRAMPTPYCKRLYRDITSSNQGKITWNYIKPIIQGKILYGPNNAETQSIVHYTNSTFEEVNRLKVLSVAIEEVLLKLRSEEKLQNALDTILKLATSPFVRSILGDTVNVDQIESVLQRLRSDPLILDVVQTIKNILECLSVDRFVPVSNANELHLKAYELGQQRNFYAGIYFNQTSDENVVYTIHMDTDNTQPTKENRNRFWFPGPSASMIQDLKYHRGFVQIKQALDLGIIKHKKHMLRELGTLTERPSTTTRSPLTVKVFNDDDVEDEDDDDWWSADTSSNDTDKAAMLPLIGAALVNNDANNDAETTIKPEEDQLASTTFATLDTTTLDLGLDAVVRQKRQGFFDDFLESDSVEEEPELFEVDNMRFYTKQFPYPAYIDDDFKTGIYLSQAVQIAFFVGLIAQVASSVRHRIWMHESRNSMIMRSMGLKSCSELTAWILVTFAELAIVFVAVALILYIGGILEHTKSQIIMLLLLIFGATLISFCYMCSTFFSSATIGAVAAGLLFFISISPWIIVLLFDAQLNALYNFGICLSFTTAFAQVWTQIMRLELQQVGLTIDTVLKEGLSGTAGFGMAMIILDGFIYAIIGYISHRYKDDEFRFVEVQRGELDSGMGATLTNVSKVYPNNKIAISNMSLSFPRDQVTCLLGRNGAGKSTIIKMLTGQVVQTSGRVVLSQAMSSTEEYDKVGVCAQDNILIPTMTPREHLELYAKIKLKHGYKSEVEKTLKSLNFGKYESYQVSKLSGGYKRRLCVAIAFIGSPNVVILDEPCNGVDMKARRDIWDLIERLRKGRTVLFTTHFLDEAEHLSNSVVIIRNGTIIAKHNRETLKQQCTTYFDIFVQCRDVKTCEEITLETNRLLSNFRVMENSSHGMNFEIAYDQENQNCPEFIAYLEQLKQDNIITQLTIESHNLGKLYKQLDAEPHFPVRNGGHHVKFYEVKLKKEEVQQLVREAPLKRAEAMRELFWKRLVHFSRNYRMLLCVLVLPAIFELLAMWFVSYRLEDDFEKVISFNRQEMYPHSLQVLSAENTKNFSAELYDGFHEECKTNSVLECKEFNNSRATFYWLLNTLQDYHGKRYGGYSFNGSNNLVWYNNKGYHAMMAWLNDLNTHIMQLELSDEDYSITSYNEPLKLGERELSTSSILRQAGDSALVFLLMIAFGLVVASASVYLVNERMKGEKLQQKLCGVDVCTYWGVAFAWDYFMLIVSLLICAAIFLAFSLPVIVDRHQLCGILVLALLFGFACIPAIHVLEKFFADASLAIVTIFSLNLIIPLFTMGIIVLLGIIGEGPTWDSWRYFLNRLFLIFPQHALGDGLLEICKNYMVALIFHRYDIDSYKHPVFSDLLLPHFIALFLVGIFFLLLNILLEMGIIERLKASVFERSLERQQPRLEELQIVSIQKSLTRQEKGGFDGTPKALEVDNLCKTYNGTQYAVRNVTFDVGEGECFGLLGKNGAGKSTIFKMLSGQLQPSLGSINYFDREISYCPQTNTLDSLLTVRECVEFYGRLRRVKDIAKLVREILESYQLEKYRDVLVKNLSGGNHRKLTVATTCLGRTSVVLMDEPTSDMDPLTRAIVYRTIGDLLTERRAIVLTSHSISEIDDICHRIAVLKDGELLTCSSPKNLNSQYGGFYNVVIFCYPQQMAEVEKVIRQRFPNCQDLYLFSNCLKFYVKINSTVNPLRSFENGVDLPENSKQSQSATELTLTELFTSLNKLARDFPALRFSVDRCRLDNVFEQIIDNAEPRAPAKSQSYISTSVLNGSAATGYVHNGYVETETKT